MYYTPKNNPLHVFALHFLTTKSSKQIKKQFHSFTAPASILHLGGLAPQLFASAVGK